MFKILYYIDVVASHYSSIYIPHYARVLHGEPSHTQPKPSSSLPAVLDKGEAESIFDFKNIKKRFKHKKIALKVYILWNSGQ